ncbi:MAG: sirohydrochlorin cobaltochelatase, partial [candidate division Zixibacteria bacterium]|nr:sirohydrochlorin cobaltochelatase [candidate division Zixibacteria bacterium]
AKIPIVMTAFGTTTRAAETYSFIDKVCRDHFPDHEILWAYTSRTVRDLVKKKKGIELKSPKRVLTELEKKDHRNAVIQSLHLLCGKEFHILVEEAKQCRIRTAIGLPLLSSPGDYYAVITELGNTFPPLSKREAIVMVGHGTDHPIWSSYIALHHMLRERFGPNIYMGVIEGNPSREDIVEAVKKSGIKKVRLIPFMLIAGLHVQEDLAGDEDSWKTAFKEKGISVSIETKGLGFQRGIIEIFCRHIQVGLDVVHFNQK